MHVPMIMEEQRNRENSKPEVMLKAFYLEVTHTQTAPSALAKARTWSSWVNRGDVHVHSSHKNGGQLL